MTHEPREALGAFKLTGLRAGRGRGEPVLQWTGSAEPARVEELLAALGHTHRVDGIRGNPNEHAVDEEQQMTSQRGDMRQLEGLLELRRRGGTISEVEQRFAEPQPGERLGARRPGLPREPRCLEERVAGAAKIAGQELDLARYGGRERLPATRSSATRLGAQPPGEGGDAWIGLAALQHALGDAEIGVEDPSGELWHPPHGAQLELRVPLEPPVG